MLSLACLVLTVKERFQECPIQIKFAGFSCLHDSNKGAFA